MIKGSGVAYDELSWGHDRLRSRRGRVEASGTVQGHRRTRLRVPAPPDVGGVVHTHSHLRLRLGGAGRGDPRVLTAMADEFGGEVPVGPFALIGDDAIGPGIVRTR